MGSICGRCVASSGSLPSQWPPARELRTQTCGDLDLLGETGRRRQPSCSSDVGGGGSDVVRWQLASLLYAVQKKVTKEIDVNEVI